MTTIRLNPGALLVFDGQVFEHFYGADSKRAHVGTLRELHLETDKGKHYLRVNANPQPGENIPGAQLILFDEKVSAQVEALVTEIQAAMATFPADND